MSFEEMLRRKKKKDAERDRETKTPPKPKKKRTTPIKDRRKHFDPLLGLGEFITWIAAQKTRDHPNCRATILRVKKRKASNWIATQPIIMFLRFLREKGYRL